MRYPTTPALTTRLCILVVAAEVIAAWAGAGYRTFLASCVETCYAWCGIRVTVVTLDVLAPMDLAFFIALCLAQLPQAPRRSWFMVALGTPIIVLAEIALAVALFHFASLRPRGLPSHPLLEQVVSTAAGSASWAIPLVVWALLRGGAPTEDRRKPPARTAGSRPRRAGSRLLTRSER